MRLATWLCRAGLLGAFAITLLTMAAVRADEPKRADYGQEALPRTVRPSVDLIDDLNALPKYWLDMKLTNVPKALDEQLQLGGKGTLVTHVGDDGPAAKAGLKAHDILLTVGDKPIEKLSDVVDEVEKSLGKEVSLKVLRAGKQMTLAITPAERYGSRDRYETPTYRLGDLDIDIQKLEAKIREKLDNVGVDVRMLLIEPGKFIPHGTGFEADKPADFPDDLNVQVTKTGKKPAQIEVKQGEKTWTVTEEKVDELPEEVRGHVKSLLGRSPNRFAISFPGGKKFTLPLPPPQAVAPGDVLAQPPQIQTRERIRGSLEHRLDEMNRELSRMRERMDGLREIIRDLDRGDKPNDDR